MKIADRGVDWALPACAVSGTWGRRYLALGEAEQAQGLLERALRINEREYGASDTEVASTLVILADVRCDVLRSLWLTLKVLKVLLYLSDLCVAYRQEDREHLARVSLRSTYFRVGYSSEVFTSDCT